MARPRKGVTLDNMNSVLQYFHNSLKRENLYRKDKSGYLENCDYMELISVDAAFNQMRVAMNKKKNKENKLPLLQEWIDTYILPEQWQRCLMTLRQKKSIKKLRLQALNLPEDTYHYVKVLSKYRGCTMNETILDIIQPHINKMYEVINSKDKKE